jgi:hypothetical protein
MLTRFCGNVAEKVDYREKTIESLYSLQISALCYIPRIPNSKIKDAVFSILLLHPRRIFLNYGW